MLRVIVRVVGFVRGAASRGDTVTVVAGAGVGEEVSVGEPGRYGGPGLAAPCRGVRWWRVASASGRRVGLVGVRVVAERRVFVRVRAPAARV